MRTANPLRLCQAATELIMDKDTDDAPTAGLTETTVPNNGDRSNLSYKITLFLKMCKELFRHSLLHGVVPFTSFVFSILVHEVAHVVAGSFSVDFTLNGYSDAVLQFIYNVLEDQRAEYKLMERFSLYAAYLQLTLATLRWKLGGDELAATPFGVDSQTLMFLTRFGVVIDGADPNFVNFAWPVILSATRGDMPNCVEAIHAIYCYLEIKYKNDADYEKAKQSSITQTALGGDEAQDVLDGSQIIANANRDVLNDILKTAQGQLDPGHVAGSDGPPPEEEKKDDSFYEAVVAGNGMIIQSLKQLFVRSKVQPVRRHANDGDVNYKRQSQIYQDSITGETGPNFIVYRRSIPSVQVAIGRDTSGSTHEFADAYATATVATLAALDGEKGVEYAHADFNSHAKLVIPFGGSITKSRIYPQSGGGTSLNPLLDEFFGNGKKKQGLHWIAKERYLLLFSDGDVDDWPHAKKRIAGYQRTHGIIPFLFNVAPGATDAGTASDVPWAMACSLQQLPEMVLAKILGMVYR